MLDSCRTRKACHSSCPRFAIYRPFSSAISHLNHEEPQSTNTYLSHRIRHLRPHSNPPTPLFRRHPLKEAAALYGGVPPIARTFSHACPTRAPSDATRVHSVLNTFFQTPVSGEENRRHIPERIASSCCFGVFLLSFNCTAAERAQNKCPVQYLLTVA